MRAHCCQAECQGRRRKRGEGSFRYIPSTSIFTWNRVHLQEINLVNTEWTVLDFVQKTLMKFLWRENSISTPGPVKLEMNAENSAMGHCRIGRIWLLWWKYNLSRRLLLNLEEKPVIAWHSVFLLAKSSGHTKVECFIGTTDFVVSKGVLA